MSYVSRRTVITPLRAWHLRAIDIQPSQAHMRERMTEDFIAAVEQTRAYTALQGGKPLACAGITEIKGRRYVWAFIGCDARPAMLRATRACEAVLSHETASVYSHVRTDIPANLRWLRLLGFAPTGESETMPDGLNYDIWVREPHV